MEINLDLLRRRAHEVRNALAVLAEYGTRPREEFLASQEAVDAAKYRLLVAVEAAIDMCTHLAARLAHTTPDGYAQCFQVLAAANILPADLAERLGRMARFRNLLVHLYAEVDDGRVWEILRYDLKDLEQYLSAVGNTLKKLL